MAPERTRCKITVRAAICRSPVLVPCRISSSRYSSGRVRASSASPARSTIALSRRSSAMKVDTPCSNESRMRMLEATASGGQAHGCRAHRAAHLRQHRVDADGAQQRALARHVRAGDQQKCARRPHLDVVAHGLGRREQRMGQVPGAASPACPPRPIRGRPSQDGRSAGWPARSAPRSRRWHRQPAGARAVPRGAASARAATAGGSSTEWGPR